MSLGNLTRIGSNEILSCTLTDIDQKTGDLHFLDINFRKAVERECGILFYEFNNTLYYPISMEFRLIDNNVLFLLNELGINKFSDLGLLLESSFRREEGREVAFFAVIYQVQELPKFSIAINGLVFDKEDKVIRI